jgi:hypothetical protein
MRRAPTEAAISSRNAIISLNLYVVSRAGAERGWAPGRRLLRKAQQARGVLADRVEHDGPLELGCDLSEDVDALGLEGAQMVKTGCDYGVQVDG